jgi:hypothetical protein
MINYWLDKINKKEETIEKINKILEESAKEKEEKEWELDV